MALPETEEALNQVIEAARIQAAAQKEAALVKVLEGTTFKSLEDLKNAQINAEKKISEQGTELGELRKLKQAAPAAQSDDEVLASASDEENEALASLYEKNKNIAKQIDAGGTKAQAEALRSLRAVKPKALASNPFKKKTQVDAGQDLAKAIREAVLKAERGSNRDTGAASADDQDNVPKIRSGASGYFKK